MDSGVTLAGVEVDGQTGSGRALLGGSNSVVRYLGLKVPL
jgi:hypothetical protein